MLWEWMESGGWERNGWMSIGGFMGAFTKALAKSRLDTKLRYDGNRIYQHLCHWRFNHLQLRGRSWRFSTRTNRNDCAWCATVMTTDEGIHSRIWRTKWNPIAFNVFNIEKGSSMNGKNASCIHRVVEMATSLRSLTFPNKVKKIELPSGREREEGESEMNERCSYYTLHTNDSLPPTFSH